MNWRNPFLVTYLGVTVLGAVILGYLLFSAYTHSAEVDANYVDAVSKLQSLQNRVPYPSPENNRKYVEYTKQYRAEYDRLLSEIGGMQNKVESITPQAFQDRLRANVSQVEAAAKENGVTLAPNFYLGFDQYRGTLPSDDAAGPLARELAAIRLIVDQMIALKVREISGIRRDLLPEEGGARAPAAPPAPRSRRRTPNSRSAAEAGPKIVTANGFEIIFVTDQSVLRGTLDFIVNARQFFIIRYLSILNSSAEGPERVAKDQAAPPPSPGQAAAAAPETSMRRLVGWETITAALRIEMITFNNLPTSK